MSLRSIIIILVLVTGFSLPNCTKSEPAYFNINGVELVHITTDHIVYFEEEPEIKRDEYAYIGLFFRVDYIADNHIYDRGFSLINSMYAKSPSIPGALGSLEESITALEIFTINDFDDDHKAGASINDLLEFNDELSVNEYLDTNTENVAFKDNWLKLLKKPTLDNKIQFGVRVELSTGEYYEATSSTITLI